jgi:hypothetical protein
VAVTDNSSAFVESSVLGTPMIVADIKNHGLENLGPVANTIFTEEMNDVQDAILDLYTGRKNMSTDGTEKPLVRIGCSTERIADTVTFGATEDRR